MQCELHWSRLPPLTFGLWPLARCFFSGLRGSTGREPSARLEQQRQEQLATLGLADANSEFFNTAMQDVAASGLGGEQWVG